MYQKHISFQKIINLVEGINQKVPINLFHLTKKQLFAIAIPLP